MERSRVSLSAAVLALVLVYGPAQSRALTLVNDYDEGTLALPANTAGAGAAVALSPDALTAYLAGGDDDSLTAVVRDPITGSMHAVDVERDGVDGVNGLANAVAVAVSPDAVESASRVDRQVILHDADLGIG